MSGHPHHRAPLGLQVSSSSPRLYDCVLEAIRLRHYSRRTEQAYTHWIRRFLQFHDYRHPQALRESAVSAFLSHLAVHRRVSASTQNQALSALLFLYEHVLHQPLERVEGVVRARQPVRLPVVLTRDEVARVLAGMKGVPRLVALLQYASGLRVLEALHLRIQDLDFAHNALHVRHGKGGNDRRTLLPASLAPVLTQHLEVVKEQHELDLRDGAGRVPLPDALARKFACADRDWRWQWVFPATSHYVDRHTGVRHRHHRRWP